MSLQVERERELELATLYFSRFTHWQYEHLPHLGVRQFSHFPQRDFVFLRGVLVEGPELTEPSEDASFSAKVDVLPFLL